MDTLQKTMETGGYLNNTLPHLPLSLSDHPNLVGIIRLPFCSTITKSVTITLPYYDNSWKMINQKVDMCTEIDQIKIEDAEFSIPKNEVADFYPYTYYVLTDGETEPLILKPQHIPSSTRIVGRFSLSHQPIERYYVKGYKGDNEGRVYNITNVNQMMLPTGTNEGINYMSANANTISQSRKNLVTDNVLSATSSLVGAIGSVLTGNVGIGAMVGASGIKNSISGLNQIKQFDSRNKDLTLTPSSISSYGTPSTRNAFNLNNVRLLKYSIDEKGKQKLRNFNKRFGNKFNNYATIDLKTYKGYVKFINPNIDSSIDNEHIEKITEILERGIYIE